MKVLFFDMWTKGVANFTRLMPELERRGVVEASMVHAGSWIDPQEDILRVYPGFICRDIAIYGTWSLYSVLKRERPDVLVMLNLYWLVDMALVQFCRKLGIRIVYLSHGRFSASASNNVNRQRKKKSLMQRLSKENINKLRNYALSTWVSGRPWQLFKTLYANVTKPVTMSLNSPYTDEMAVDDVIVYYDSDKRLLVDERHFPEGNIHVVGNPEFDQLFTAPERGREEVCASIGMADGPYLLYLDDGFVQNGYIDAEAWHEHLAEMATLAREAGLQMAVKLHPRTPIEQHRDFFAEHGIAYAQGNADFPNLLRHSSAVTSLVSTTISFALALGRPVVSPRWGITQGISRSYSPELVRYAESAPEFLNILKNKDFATPSQQYIYDHFGSPGQQAIPKIVDIIVGAGR